ncbi:uncharacterized protein PHALS_09712 [Plasmopara halstedii]|uniref:Uncharacterized protein n=1 Tax=Plasmopara halstedii TaxID=4781 RepID=A0A0N7L4S2_PLAHL|nr:uncharacterized protein PHALS_09712 [Plasmopara halstedii]CEG39467.1 hypothetical protein PHALS_09712 [Plasmopara halstedii]|eukprot:XP_024575836.1 hypothetical protein PHALS_09712 [Plasmopara halstedii]
MENVLRRKPKYDHGRHVQSTLWLPHMYASEAASWSVACSAMKGRNGYDSLMPRNEEHMLHNLRTPHTIDAIIPRAQS